MTRLLHTLFVGPIGRLPYWMLYPIADGLATLLWWTGYRKKVVLANLAGVFPEKSEAERTRIARDFFTHLAEVLVESLQRRLAERPLAPREKTDQGAPVQGAPADTIDAAIHAYLDAHPGYPIVVKKVAPCCVGCVLAGGNWW